MSEKFNVISRDAIPPLRNGRPLGATSAAVLATVGTAQAVRIELNGRKPSQIRNVLWQTARSHNLTLHTRLVENRSVMIAWTEAKEPVP